MYALVSVCVCVDCNHLHSCKYSGISLKLSEWEHQTCFF